MPDELDGVRVVRIDAGAEHSLALTSDGAVVAWGANDKGQSEVPTALQGVAVTRVAAGGKHNLALTGKGTLVAWGERARGKTELPTVLRGVRVTRVVAGDDHNLVLARHRGRDVQIRGNRRGDLWRGNGPSRRYAGNNFFHTRNRLADLGGGWVADGWPETQDVAHPFRVRVYNDSRTIRRFRIRGSAARVDNDGRRPHWDPSLVRYYNGETEVTRALQSRRGIKVRIKPGSYRQFRMLVALAPEWALVMRSAAILSATHVGHPRHSDRVRGTTAFID